MKQLYYVELNEGSFIIRCSSEDEAFELLANHLESTYLEVHDFEVLETDIQGESQVLLH